MSDILPFSQHVYLFYKSTETPKNINTIIYPENVTPNKVEDFLTFSFFISII